MTSVSGASVANDSSAVTTPMTSSGEGVARTCRRARPAASRPRAGRGHRSAAHTEARQERRAADRRDRDRQGRRRTCRAARRLLARRGASRPSLAAVVPAPRGMQRPPLVDDARDRPVGRVDPLVRAHQEEANPRRRIRRRTGTAEVLIEEPQVDRRHVHHRLRGEDPELLGPDDVAVIAMRPRPDEQALPVTGRPPSPPRGAAG